MTTIPQVTPQDKHILTRTDKLNSILVQDIKSRNPKLGLARILYLVTEHESKMPEWGTLLWNHRLLAALDWSNSPFPPELWNTLFHGKHTAGSLANMFPNIWGNYYD